MHEKRCYILTGVRRFYAIATHSCAHSYCVRTERGSDLASLKKRDIVIYPKKVWQKNRKSTSPLVCSASSLPENYTSWHGHFWRHTAALNKFTDENQMKRSPFWPCLGGTAGSVQRMTTWSQPRRAVGGWRAFRPFGGGQDRILLDTFGRIPPPSQGRDHSE